ncbi:hypothetical protein R1sor_025189 [Riccia sorocarpa]|uniref:Uncharacterized protein n=1 Tax=Riccia sorocarpa TaxID=122646 RepID=A0ABD3G9G0_9MARC
MHGGLATSKLVTTVPPMANLSLAHMNAPPRQAMDYRMAVSTTKLVGRPNILLTKNGIKFSSGASYHVELEDINYVHNAAYNNTRDNYYGGQTHDIKPYIFNAGEIFNDHLTASTSSQPLTAAMQNQGGEEAMDDEGGKEASLLKHARSRGGGDKYKEPIHRKYNKGVDIGMTLDKGRYGQQWRQMPIDLEKQMGDRYRLQITNKSSR